jgi:SAM-dependent methyltransferase
MIVQEFMCILSLITSLKRANNMSFLVAYIYDKRMTETETACLRQLRQEIKRVLKPGGRFIFLEHIRAELGSSRRRWQNTLNPVWKKIAGNCHLNRHTQQAIINAGFEIEFKKRKYAKTHSLSLANNSWCSTIPMLLRCTKFT